MILGYASGEGGAQTSRSSERLERIVRGRTEGEFDMSHIYDELIIIEYGDPYCV